MAQEIEDLASASIRRAAFEWARNSVATYGDVLGLDFIKQGFEFRGEKIHLISRQGIFKPAQIGYFPLTITTTPNSPYKDAFEPNSDLLLYRYRGFDPRFHENKRLRACMQNGIPLIYFHGTMPGRYITVWPVYVVNDDPQKLTFTVAADDPIQLSYQRDDTDNEIRRGYITRQTRQRIHQRTFRDRVLSAYKEQCTVCCLRHTKMLEAAHIIPDSEPEGEPVITNGLSLCKLHHAAFDQAFFGIRPDFSIEVRHDILEESDGPMLKHGLQEIHDSIINLPSRRLDWPDPERLESRYKRFVSNDATAARSATE